MMFSRIHGVKSKKIKTSNEPILYDYKLNLKPTYIDQFNGKCR